MKLARREKYFVSIAFCTIVVFFVFQLLIFPFFEKRDRIRRGIEAGEVGLAEMMRLSAEYHTQLRGSRGIKQIIARRHKTFTLFSFLERAAGRSEVKGHIKYMKPSESETIGRYRESMVEIKLESITLKQLVEYLHRIESEENGISIKRILIKANKRKYNYLDAVLQVVTFRAV
jgi:general secretion pathway protein M